MLARAPLVLREFAAASRELEWRLPEPPSVDELEETGAGEVHFIEESL
ncbi:MAG: hypothetical protein ACLUEQ_09455 [Cloacibacillus evryensis]